MTSLKAANNIITVFEHEAIRTTDKSGCKITEQQLKALQEFSGTRGVPYFTPIYNGVKFGKYVGVLQVGQLTIEVLPKIDRVQESDKKKWKKTLIDMLKKVGAIDLSISGETNLKIKRNSILELYVTRFIEEIEKLIHRGLIKKYRKTEANNTALKGKILFSKHLSKNTIHKERFFVKYSIYDKDHKLNSILYSTLQLIKTLNLNPSLVSKASNIILNFPEMVDVKASEKLFDDIVYNKRSESYRPALLISRLLLLNYHPDINSGKNHVLALMFDMNLMWEKFVYVSLRKYLKDGKVDKQSSKPYWKMSGKRAINLRPDVVVVKKNIRYILDTKWKVPSDSKPGSGDLQQMYAYTKYFHSDHTILCYPGVKDDYINGFFFSELGGEDNHRCSILRIGLDESMPVYKWQEKIAAQINARLVRN